MTTLILPHLSTPHGATPQGRPRTDLMRASLIVMLLLNVALAIMLLTPAEDARPIAQSPWHGNAAGAAIE